ncbi:MAG TPA: TonB-dependent receptor [Gemmatimonadales bacterium]|nr:TonB-dependent receptor [Gemmatimonadales bacterium]
MRRRGFLSLFASLLFTAAGPAFAQQTRTVRGHVFSATDSTPMNGVEVGAVGQKTIVLTNQSGRFSLRVPAGDVQLTIHGIGITPDTIPVSATTDTVRIYARPLAIELAPVGVEARPPARARFDTLAQTSTITLSPQEMKRTPGLLEPDIIRAVQLLPGTVARNDYSVGYNVRGGESDQNLVRLDGITIFNPSHLGGLFSTFDVNAVDHADFLTGGFPAEYSGRLSSVLDVAVRPGNHEELHGSGTVSLLSSKILLEAPAGPVSVLFSARRTYADEAVKLFTSQTLPYYFTDLLGKIDYPYGARGDLSFTGYWGRDVLALNLIPAAPGVTPVDLAFDWGNGLAGVNWRQPVGASLLESHVSVTQFSSGLELNPSLVNYSNPAVLWSGGTALALPPLARQDIKVGVEYEHYDLRYTVSNPAIPSALGYRGSFSPAFFNTLYRPAVLAGYVDDRWQPGRALLVRAGVRVERVTSANATDVAPRASFKVFLTPDQAITGSLGRYYQVVQSLSDEELPIAIYEFWVGANGRIPVAQSDHLVLGYERWFGQGRATQFTVEGYRKTFSNLIRPNAALSLRDTSDVFLPADGDAWGVDVLLRRHVGRVRGWIAYSFVHATRHSEGLTYPPSHDRRHTLNIVAELPGVLHSDFGIRFGVGSPLPYTALLGSWDHGQYSPGYAGFTDDANSEPLGGPLNGARYPPYSRLDMGFRWHGHHWGIQWEPYLDIVNVLDRQNVFAYFFDTDKAPPTRTAFFQLPILVTAGVDFSW